VVINLDPDGTIDVSYGGVTVLNNVQTPYRASLIGAPSGCSARASVAPMTIIGSTTCASGRGWRAIVQ